MSAADRELAIKLVVDARDGANFAWVHIPIGGRFSASGKMGWESTHP